MAKYILKRVLRSLITMVIVITVVFSLLRLMPIEGYFENFDKLSETQIQARLTDLGLNDPLPVQLGNFFNQLLHGDLGESIKYRKNVAITTIIAEKIPISLFIGLTSLAIAMALGHDGPEHPNEVEAVGQVRHGVHRCHPGGARCGLPYPDPIRRLPGPPEAAHAVFHE